jgi:hypothetical protein
MKSKLVVMMLGALLSLSIAGSVFAAQPGPPKPQPPKCTPASTPGCSGK